MPRSSRDLENACGRFVKLPRKGCTKLVSVSRYLETGFLIAIYSHACLAQPEVRPHALSRRLYLEVDLLHLLAQVQVTYRALGEFNVTHTWVRSTEIFTRLCELFTLVEQSTYSTSIVLKPIYFNYIDHVNQPAWSPARVRLILPGI